MTDYEEFRVRMQVCAENLISAFACLGRACTKVMVDIQRSFIVNRRTRRAAEAGRLAAARWYAAEHRRRATSSN